MSTLSWVGGGSRKLLISSHNSDNLFFYLSWIKNKPSFCSGSCNEWHVATKLQNKSSLKHSKNTLHFFWKFLETRVTLSLNTLETSSKQFWNSLETTFEFLLDTLETHMKGLLKHPSIFLETPFPQTTLKPLSNTLDNQLNWKSLQSTLKHPWIFPKHT